jgi:hypothetical protein
VNQVFTYLGGFHSLRQILYGTLAAIVAFCVFLGFGRQHYKLSFLALGSVMAGLLLLAPAMLTKELSPLLKGPGILCYPMMAAVWWADRHSYWN